MSDRPLVDLKFRVDTKGWARQLGGFAKDVLPFAASYSLNGVVFAARDALRDEAKRVFDRPVDFTVRNAFGYTRARLNGDMTARIYIRDRQSAYYAYQIKGGTRVPGNIGPGQTWLFMPVAEELVDPASGGLRRNVLRGLSRRAAPKGKGGAVHRTTRARDAKRRPVFFASVFGTQAIWERPERTKATGPRRRGVRQVHNLSAPRLLVAAYRQEEYRRPRFDFQGIVARAYEDLPVLFDQAVKQRLGRILSDRGLSGR
ncbi:hypothetical protein [Methylobacterium sp. 391_Methyba4]|uniref:hypothetical protein n=1 Tax=Methylobacterium sp. 391_Methyba4 TaxID=3038924 RepID=UPI00241CBD90|nr:hypothetical protein [Methylobacterium sp. 391_Methyba4]WFS10448.1 hypothetical protein P9K36_14710 [Methylobacterium sp. 391_Methyba4]